MELATKPGDEDAGGPASPTSLRDDGSSPSVAGEPAPRDPVRTVAAWPLFLVVAVAGAAFMLRHIRHEGAAEGKPREDRAAPAVRRGGASGLRGRSEAAEEHGLTAADLAPHVLAAAGLAGLCSVLSKSRRSWLFPPPAKAPPTTWGTVELFQGLMLAVSFMMLTGELVQTLFRESLPGSSLTVFAMQACLAATIILLTAPHAATTSNRDVQDAQDGKGQTSCISRSSSLKAVVRPLGLSLEGAGTDALRGLAGGVIAFPLAWAAGILGGLVSVALGVEPPVHPLIEQAGTTAGALDLVVIFASGAVAAPIAEEFLFRGFIFPSIRDRWGLAAGILVSSLVFGIVHPGLPNQAATVVLGAVFCALYERTGTLVAPVTAHSFFNLAMLSMRLLQRFGV